MKQIIKNKKLQLISLGVIFAAVGLYFLYTSLAATPFVSLEPESGTVSPPAVAVADTTASGSKSVKFTASTGGTVLRVAAVGDIHPPSASANSAATATEANKADFILGLGDYQYQTGTLSDFNNYFDKDWGPIIYKMYPVLAPTHDQDWNDSDPMRYFNGAGAHGYKVPITLKSRTPYSFDKGSWHFIVLPDACYRVSGCDTAAITTWLKADLAAHTNACTIAYWHQAYFTSPSSGHSAYTTMKPWVDVLGANRVDIVLQGHQHNYERFAPQNSSNVADPNGMQAFVVGTGGIGFYGFSGTAANSVTRQSNNYGVLQLTLNEGSYSWQFVPVNGGTYTDSGSMNCR